MANKNPSPQTRWKKGQSGNPKGRQKDIYIGHLRDAINRTEEKEGVNLWDRFVEMAFADPGAMRTLIAKFVADRKQIDVDVRGDVTFEVVDKYVEKPKDKPKAKK